MFPAMQVYDGNGVNIRWPVPFLYSDPAEVGVRLQAADGQERRLTYGVEYAVMDRLVFCPVAAGEKIAIFLDAGNVSSSAAMATLAAPQSSPQALARIAPEPAPLEEAPTVSDLRSEASRIVEKASEEVSSVCAVCAGEAERQLKAQAEEIRAQLRIAASPVPQAATLKGISLAAGECLELPVSYVPLTNTLLLIRNGLILTPGLDYEEVEGELASSVILLRPISPTDFLHIRVAAIASTASANLASKQAMEHQRASAAMVQDTARHAAETRQIWQNCQQELGSAESWARAAHESADLAHQSATRVYEAVSHVSIHAHRPGISTVKRVEDIGHAAPGVFLVNPHISHSPTFFMGIWPVDCPEEMGWDGVFFIGHPYPADPALPPKRPPRPQGIKPATGDGDDWIPCDHDHAPPPPPPHHHCCHAKE